MSLLEVHSDAAAGIVAALIAAEAMRTVILLMSELQTYSSACLSSIARESFWVRLWLRRAEHDFRWTRACRPSRVLAGLFPPTILVRRTLWFGLPRDIGRERRAFADNAALSKPGSTDAAHAASTGPWMAGTDAPDRSDRAKLRVAQSAPLRSVAACRAPA
jgi:hypothetical protein